MNFTHLFCNKSWRYARTNEFQSITNFSCPEWFSLNTMWLLSCWSSVTIVVYGNIQHFGPCHGPWTRQSKTDGRINQFVRRQIKPDDETLSIQSSSFLCDTNLGLFRWAILPFCHSTILLLLSIQSHLTPSIYSSYNLRGKNGLYYIAVNYKEIRVEIQMHKQKERHVEPRNGFF